jgi:hypothetical protein
LQGKYQPASLISSGGRTILTGGASSGIVVVVVVVSGTVVGTVVVVSGTVVDGIVVVGVQFGLSGWNSHFQAEAADVPSQSKLPTAIALINFFISFSFYNF